MMAGLRGVRPRGRGGRRAARRRGPAADARPRPPCACATASAMLTDGPFAETREQLGGYYLVDAADLDEAIALGGRRSPAPPAAPSRSARSWTTRRPRAEAPAAKTRRRAAERRPAIDLDRLFRRESGQAVALLARVARRPRPRRGGRPGRVRGRARALAARRRARATRRRGSSTVARRRAIDRIRRRAPLRAQRAARRGWRRSRRGRARGGRGGGSVSPIPDERLRLIFTCCHPALAPEARVALTLRAARRADHGRGRARVPGLRAGDGAAPRAREGEDPRRAASPTSVPRDADLPARLGSVLATLYLVFNEGYAATAGDALVRRELCAEAIRLGARAVRADARRARGARPARADAAARLAPRGARGRGGRLVLLADQDRARWDRAAIAEGSRWSSARSRCGGSGAYVLQAAIAAEHARAAGRGHRLGARSRRSTTRLRGSTRARSSRSTARSPWRWRAARRRGWRSPTSWPSALDGYHLFHADAGRPAAPARPRRGGGGRLRARARAGRQPGRARVPRGRLREVGGVETCDAHDERVRGRDHRLDRLRGRPRRAGGRRPGAGERGRPLRAAATSTSPVHPVDLGAALEGVDVLVEYTSHEAAKRHALAALERGVAVVIGSSGLTAEDFEEIEAAATAAGVSARLRQLLADRRDGAGGRAARRPAPAVVGGNRLRERGQGRRAERDGARAGREARRRAQPRSRGRSTRSHGPREARGTDVAGTRVHSVRLPSFVVSTEVVFGLPDERLTIRHDAGGTPGALRGGHAAGGASRAVELTGLVRGLAKLLAGDGSATREAADRPAVEAFLRERSALRVARLGVLEQPPSIRRCWRGRRRAGGRAHLRHRGRPVRGADLSRRRARSAHGAIAAVRGAHAAAGCTAVADHHQRQPRGAALLRGVGAAAALHARAV